MRRWERDEEEKIITPPRIEYICDRCGKQESDIFFRPEASGLFMNRKVDWSILDAPNWFRISEECPDSTAELCPNCTKGLLTWWKGKVEIERMLSEYDKDMDE